MAVTAVSSSMLDKEFLDIRSRLLDVAAMLDRIDRAGDSSSGDARRQSIRNALALLASEEPARAEKLQLLLSLEYDSHWRSQFNV